METVRIPVSVVPHEDLSAKYQKQLKMQRSAGIDVSDPAAVEMVSDGDTVKDGETQVRDGSGSAAEGTAANTQPSGETTVTPSDSHKKE